MTEATILQYYWHVFISHVCEFYPLERSLIEQYDNELDWKSLSNNKIIDWDLEFIEQYEDRWAWHLLAMNHKILWTEDNIDRFKKRLDWLYLNQNKYLPITDAFIQKYARKLSVVEDNVHLNQLLIAKHNLRILPSSHHDTQKIKNLKEDQFEEILETFTFYHNQLEVFKKIFLPIVKRIGLGDILKSKFDYSQRYYFLEPILYDIHGLTPEFVIAGNNPLEIYREERELFELDETLTLINGTSRQGPDRLLEVPRFSSFSFCTTLLVSENVKSILEQFKLPKHRYHEVQLKPRKLTTTTRFYLLLLSFDTLSKDLDYAHGKFYCSHSEMEDRGHRGATYKIDNYHDLMKMKDILKENYVSKEYGGSLKPKTYKLTSDFDLYTFSVHGAIIVNQYLKEALEKNFPKQMAFKSAQLLNIKIEQAKYDSKANLKMNLKLASKLNYKESEEDKFYYAKAERLEKEEPELDTSLLEKGKFFEKEIELKVVFPKLFKNKGMDRTIRRKEYDLLPISGFYIENAYAAKHPETYKSVVVAENGLGDSIILMLERDSDFILQSRLFEFFHETGEYEEI